MLRIAVDIGGTFTDVVGFMKKPANCCSENR